MNPTVLDFLPQEVCYSLQTIDFRFLPATRLLETAADGRTLSKMCPNLTSLNLSQRYELDVKLLENLPPNLLEFELFSQIAQSIPVDLLPRSLTSITVLTQLISNEGAWPPFLTRLTCRTDDLQAFLLSVPPSLEHLSCYIPCDATLRISEVPPGLVTLSLEEEYLVSLILDAPLPSCMRTFAVLVDLLLTPDGQQVAYPSFETEELFSAKLASFLPATLEKFITGLRMDFVNKYGRSLRTLTLENSYFPDSMELLFPPLLQHYSGALNHRIEQCFVAAGIRLKSLYIYDVLDDGVSYDFLEFLGKSLVSLNIHTDMVGMFTDEFYERKPLQSYNTGFETLTLSAENEKSNSSENIARFWSDPLLPPSCTDITIKSSYVIPEVAYLPMADWRKFGTLRRLSCRILVTFQDVKSSEDNHCTFVPDPPVALLPPTLLTYERTVASGFTSEMIRSLPRSLSSLTFTLWEFRMLNSWTLDHWKSLPPRLAQLHINNRLLYQPIEGAPSIVEIEAALPQTLTTAAIYKSGTKAMKLVQQYGGASVPDFSQEELDMF